MSHHKIEAKSVTFAYPDAYKAISNISFTVMHGESVGIIGANGAGKSTLLMLLMGVLFPTSGEVRIGEATVTKQNLSLIRKHLGLVFQNPDDQLFMTTVYEDVAFGPRNYRINEDDVKEKVKIALETVGISHLSERSPFTLSGGEKRAAAIASVLSMQPDALIMDEPTNDLDPRARRKIIALMKSFTHTKIIASHDMDMILETCERTIVIQNGMLVADGETKKIITDYELMDKCGLEVPLSIQKCPVCGTKKNLGVYIMQKEKITSVVKSGKVLVSDGAWGTFLHKKGLKPGECPEQWCVTRFDDVSDIAKSYAEAGSDMVETNSFGGTSFKLAHYGLSENASEINEAAAKASRFGVGESKWVIASIGPTGKMLITEEVTEDEMYNAFKEQAIALEKGGADAVCIETMSDIEEACLAIKATKENTKLEIICTFTFERTVKGEYRSMFGVSPTDAAKACVEAGADIVGTNCGNGIERMIDIVKEIRAAAPETPILVHANAGLPVNVDGKDVFPETPSDMAGRVNELIAAGANIVGGCCGTTPDHIKAMREAITCGCHNH